MEPGIKEFFKRLALSISLFVLWMMINMTFGIKLGYAFFDSLGAGNLIFYIWMILSFAVLIMFYIRLWKKPIEHLDD